MNDFRRLEQMGKFAVLVLSVAACGGNVDLGGERSAASTDVFATSADAPQPDEHADAAWPFTESFDPLQLAVAGDFLYLLGFSRLGRGAYDMDGMAVARCNKHNCGDTAQFMIVPRGFLELQAFEGRMGVVARTEGGLSLLASYALPDLDDEEVVMHGLPNWQSPLFHRGFVYWSFSDEAGIYRCALPNCEQGPTRLQTQRHAGAFSIDEDALFYVAAGVIHRAAGLGERLAVGLSPDDRLSELPPYDASMPEGGTRVVATAEGMLYASFHSAECLDTCTWTLARWPARGGTRQLLVESTNFITSIFVQGPEVAWVESGPRREDGVLFSCVIDSCVTTRRELGTVLVTPAVAVDDDFWYWLEAQDSRSDELGQPQWSYRQLRRTPLMRTEAP